MRLRVFLVEDNPLNLELHRDLLEAAGHEVLVAENAAQLRTLMGRGEVPDLVLMDILLPDVSGIELLGELRLRPHLAGVPVVALTAQALAGDVARLKTEGFGAVIVKPIDTRTFVEEVTHWSGR